MSNKGKKYRTEKTPRRSVGYRLKEVTIRQIQEIYDALPLARSATDVIEMAVDLLHRQTLAVKNPVAAGETLPAGH